MNKNSQGFTILFSPSPVCNLRCVYCPLPKDTLRIDETQTLQTFDRLLTIIEDYLKRHPQNNISFVIHGNEPTIIGAQLLEHIFATVYEIRKKTQRINLGIQTNGTLITDEIAEIFKKYEVAVGVSIDGWASAHNTNRKYASGLPSYRDVMRGMRKLREHQVPFGIISVITKAHMKDGATRGAKKYYEWLEQNDITSALVHIVSLSKNFERYTEIHPTYAEYIEFFLTLYEIWKEKSDGRNIGPFTDMMETLLFGEGYDGGMCTFRKEHCAPIVEIRYDGQIHTCDRNTYYIGKLEDYKDLESILSDSFSKAGDRSELLKGLDPVCGACKYWSACHGGCTHEGMMRYFDMLADGEPPRTNDPQLYRTKYCPIYRILFKTIEQDLRDLGYSIAI